MALTERARRTWWARTMLVLLSLVLAAGLLACGDDDDEETTGDDTEDTEQASGEDPDEFCEAAVSISVAFTEEFADFDFEGSTPEQVQAKLGEVSDRVEPDFERVEETAPEEIAADVEIAVASGREALETGEEEESAELDEAERNIDEYVIEECDVQSHEVTAVDYEFEDVPETVDAGVVIFDFSNEGDELHEMQLFRINDDVEESAEELLELPEAEVEQKVTLVGGAFEEPGGTTATYFDLEAGRYGAVCFIPVGLTPEAAEQADQGGPEPEGPPHFTRGMFVEFEVE